MNRREFFSMIPMLAMPVVMTLNSMDDEKIIELERSWGGDIKIELRGEAPEDGYIVSQKEWSRLWKAYRGDEELPKVDFDRELVLVGVNRDPNHIAIRAKLDDKGDLTLAYITTLMAIMNPRTCKYQFGVIKRAGIKTINGKPLKKG